MNKKIISYVLLIALVTFVPAACSKKRGPDTASAKLLGKWKLAKLASDDNHNGVIDGYEIHPVSPLQDIEYLFNNDAVCVEYNSYAGKSEPNVNFEWGVINGDTLRINLKANDTLNYFLVNITSGDLTVTENSPQGLQWFYFVKE
jgi:hypothetical protein